MTVHNAQQRHIAAALLAEQERMARFRPRAIESIIDLIEAMKRDTTDEVWGTDTLKVWDVAQRNTEYAVSGQGDGWFNETWAHPVDMIKALFDE